MDDGRAEPSASLATVRLTLRTHDARATLHRVLALSGEWRLSHGKLCEDGRLTCVFLSVPCTRGKPAQSTLAPEAKRLFAPLLHDADALAKADAEVMGRALEGRGFAYESKAQATPADKDKLLDQAMTEFKGLENTDVAGFKELGMYHQGRVAEARGDVAKAKETLKALHDRLNEPGANHPLPYLQELCDDRLRRIDPTALPAKEQGSLGGPSGKGLTPAQMKQLFSPKGQ